MIKELIKLANNLDNMGRHDVANYIDGLIEKISAQQMDLFPDPTEFSSDDPELADAASYINEQDFSGEALGYLMNMSNDSASLLQCVTDKWKAGQASIDEAGGLEHGYSFMDEVENSTSSVLDQVKEFEKECRSESGESSETVEDITEDGEVTAEELGVDSLTINLQNKNHDMESD